MCCLHCLRPQSIMKTSWGKRICALCLDHTPQWTRQVVCAALHGRNSSPLGLDPNIGLSSRRVANGDGPGSKTIVWSDRMDEPTPVVREKYDVSSCVCLCLCVCVAGRKGGRVTTYPKLAPWSSAALSKTSLSSLRMSGFGGEGISCIWPFRPTKTISSSSESSDMTSSSVTGFVLCFFSSQVLINLRTSSSNACKRPLAALAFLSFSRSSLGTLPAWLSAVASFACFVLLVASAVFFSAATWTSHRGAR